MITTFKQKGVVGGVLAVIIVLVVLFLYRYQVLNASGKEYKVHEEKLKCGEMIEDAGMMLSFDKISKERKYDKDYQSEVYHYQISFTAKNISEENFNLQNKLASRVVLVSAGEKWYADLLDSETAYLKKGETKKGKISIDVIQEDGREKKAYDDYKLYFIQKEENGAFLYWME